MAVERVTDDEQAADVEGAPINVDVVIADRIPTRDLEVRNSVGKLIRTLRQVDKSAIFALPAGTLRATAAIATFKPSGKVLIQTREGELLARFADREQATKHLKAAGVDITKLAGGRVATREKEAAKGRKAEK